MLRIYENPPSYPTKPPNWGLDTAATRTRVEDDARLREPIGGFEVCGSVSEFPGCMQGTYVRWDIIGPGLNW